MTDEINNYLNALQQQQNEDILVLNKSISVMNKITEDINNNTEIINKNLHNLANILNEQNTRFDLFETVITLIIQEQHFLNLLEKIKRSFRTNITCKISFIRTLLTKRINFTLT